jgi:hypothetical protein
MRLADGCRRTRARVGKALACALLLAGCVEDPFETPLIGPIDEGFECDDRPDASTPLGVSGEDLWRVYAGTYTVTAQRVRLASGKVSGLPETELTITVQPSDETVSAADDCSRVIVPVHVSVTDDDSLEEDALGVLLWSRGHGQVSFSSALSRDDLPRVEGTLDFSEDLGLTVALFVTTADEEFRYSHRGEDATP